MVKHSIIEGLLDLGDDLESGSR